MIVRQCDFPLMNKRVKVTNPKYINGSYEGIIIGIILPTLEILVQHNEGSDGWEKLNECELVEEIITKKIEI